MTSASRAAYMCILKVRATIEAANKGKQIHDEIARDDANQYCGRQCLVDVYSMCGAILKVKQVVEGLSCQDVVLWDVVIVGYAQEDQSQQALYCFEQMQPSIYSNMHLVFLHLFQPAIDSPKGVIWAENSIPNGYTS